MTPGGFRRSAMGLLASFIAGLALVLAGSLGRDFPPKMDSAFAVLDGAKEHLRLSTWGLAPGESHQEVSGAFALRIRRLSQDQGLERYVLEIHPARPLRGGRTPSAWMAGVVAWEENAERRVRVVAIRRLKE